MLREADKTSVTKVPKKHSVSEQTPYMWRKKYGDMDVADTKRLKALEAENSKLKKLLAEREIDVMKEIFEKVVSAPVRRQQVELARRRVIDDDYSCRFAPS